MLGIDEDTFEELDPDHPLRRALARVPVADRAAVDPGRELMR